MTGYTVHTGTSKKFVSGWDHIFSGGDAAAETKAPKGKAKKKKKAAKKSKKTKK
jgi:hypothetical protein